MSDVGTGPVDAETQALVDRLKAASGPSEADREDFWGIAREMKRTRDQLRAAQAELADINAETEGVPITVGELRGFLQKADPQRVVVLHVGGSIFKGLTGIYLEADVASGSPSGPQETVVILTGQPPPSDPGSMQ